MASHNSFESRTWNVPTSLWRVTVAVIYMFRVVNCSLWITSPLYKLENYKKSRLREFLIIFTSSSKNTLQNLL